MRRDLSTIAAPDKKLQGSLDKYEFPISMSTNASGVASRALRLLNIDRDLLTQGKEYRTTFVTEFGVSVSLLLTYKMAAHGFGKAGFSEYAVARRTISLIFPALLLGLPLALSRYVAYTTRDENRSLYYYGAALWCLGFSVAACTALITFFRGAFAYLFFGSPAYAYLALPMGLVLIGLTIHSAVYAYYRGNLALNSANLLQFVNFGLVPLFVFARFGSSVHSVLTFWGVGTILVATAGLLFTPWRQATATRSWNEGRELLRYGLQRIPGVFAFLALMTLPTTFAVHLRGVQQGGGIAFGVSLLNMVGALFTPIGVVLLPKASQMFADGADEALRAHVMKLISVTVLVALVFTIGFELLAGIAIRIYLGADFSSVAALTRVVALGAVPFSVYYVLQGLIDAYHIRAVNGWNCIYSLGIFLLACLPAFVYEPMEVIPVAFLVGIFSLGLLTAREAWRILPRRSRGKAPAVVAPEDAGCIQELEDNCECDTRDL